MKIGKMTSGEWRATISLSSIMGLRMIGLFMVLPVFSLYAEQLKGATPALVGLSLGIYGLTQACFQIPFGALSDRFGRKPLLLIGLLFFALGSLLASFAHSMTLMIIGRALQGMGAIGSTTLAMLADLTRVEQRTKVMAIAGISIGFSFLLAMALGPVLAQWMPVNGLFLLAVLFSLVAILILVKQVPTPAISSHHPETTPELKPFYHLLVDPELFKLNTGIFLLHALFTASFMVIPISLLKTGLSSSQQWRIYLPALLSACLISLFCIGLSERRNQVKPYFVGGIIILGLSELLLWIAPHHFLPALIGLGLFFTGFSLLEGFLPSLISRLAPREQKGTALGIYSSAQFLGIFAGGICGGWLYGKFELSGVYLFCFLLTLLWLSISLRMRHPNHPLIRQAELQSD